MSIFSRGLDLGSSSSDSGERRSISLQDAFSRGLPFGQVGASDTAKGVTATTAARLTAVSRATGIISDACSALDIGVFAESPSGEVEARPLPRWLRQPNAEMMPFEYFEAQWMSLLYRGNYFAQVITADSGEVLELWPLNPDAVTPVRDGTGRIVYLVRHDDGTESTHPRYTKRGPSGILHLAWYKSPGDLVGRDPIAQHREAIGLGLVTERYGSEFFSNDASASGIIELPHKADKTRLDRIKDGWELSHRGAGNRHRVGVLSDGATFRQLSVTPENAQFLDTRRFQVAEIGRIFGVPGFLLGDVERSSSWGAGIEEQGIGFVKFTLRPLLKRGSEKYSMLLPGDEFMRYKSGELHKGTMGSRFTSYAKAIQGGWMSPNDVREEEGQNRIEGGDDYLRPLYMGRVEDDGSLATEHEQEAGAV